MNYVTRKDKRRFVHRNDPPDPLGKVKCGAWTFYGQYFTSWAVLVDPADVWKYHKCRKCFPPVP